MVANLEKLDMFGQEFSFNVTRKKNKFRTNIGAVVSLVCIIITVGGFYIFTSELLDTTNPRTSINTQITNNYPMVDLRENGFLPMFTLFGLTGQVPVDQMMRYFTPVLVKYTIGVNPDTNQITIDSSRRQKVVSCDKSNHGFEDSQDIKRDSGADIFSEGNIYASCPEDMTDQDFWSVKGTAGRVPFEFISLNFYPCSLPNPGDCAPVQELVNFELHLSLLFNTYKLSDKKHPVQRIYAFQKLSFALNPRVTQISEIFFKKIEVWDEDLDFFQASLNKEFFSLNDIKLHDRYRMESLVYCDQNAIDSLMCPAYSSITLKSGSEIQTIYRVYPKLFNTISELGGFGDLIFICAGFLYVIYNNYLFSKWVCEDSIWKDQDSKLFVRRNKISKKEFDRMRLEFVEEKMNGISLLENMAVLEGLTSSTLSPLFQRGVQLIPIINRIKNQRDQRETKNLNFETVRPIDAINRILKTTPRNDIEKYVKSVFVEFCDGESTIDESALMVGVGESFDGVEEGVVLSGAGGSSHTKANLYKGGGSGDQWTLKTPDQRD